MPLGLQSPKKALKFQYDLLLADIFKIIYLYLYYIITPPI